MTAATMLQTRNKLADHYVLALIRSQRSDESPITPEQVEQKRASIQAKRQRAQLRKACQPRPCHTCDRVKPHEDYTGRARDCDDCRRTHDREYQREYTSANPVKKQVGVKKALSYAREHLTDSYIRRLIVVEKDYREGDEITPERIEAKRQGIAAKRDRRAQRQQQTVLGGKA